MFRKYHAASAACHFLPASLIVLAAVLAARDAHAVRSGVIQSDTAEVLQAPEPTALIVENLAHGDRVVTVDSPSQGYYRARTGSGKIGWIVDSAISFTAEWVAPNLTDPKSPAYRVSPGASRRPSPRGLRSSFGARLFGGLDFFNVHDFEETTLKPDNLTNGYDGGVEILYRVSPAVTAIFHVEKIFKSVELTVDSTGSIYDFGINSLPLMIGAEYLVWKQRQFELAGAALAGLALSTSFTSTQATAPAPNLTQYGGNPLTALARFQGDYAFTASVKLGIQVGYRLLIVGSAPPVATGAGNQNLEQGTNPNHGVGLSGPFASIMGTFWF